MRIVFGALCVLSVAACSAPAASNPQAALLQKPSAKARAEVSTVIASALGRETVTLADDALTQQSEIVIARTLRRDERGRPLDGRSMEQPDHFRLVMQGSECILIHQETQARFTLREARCKME